MARTYSPDLIEAVNYRGPYNLGRELGKVCVAANIPATYVAFMLNTTRPTIHAWFRGGVIRDSKKHMIEVLINLMEKDLKDEVLPVDSLKKARAYCEEMVGRPMNTAGSKPD